MRLGNLYVGEIQKRIADGIEPPNAPLTIKLKGSSTPLIETGQLRTSIRFHVGNEASSGSEGGGEAAEAESA